MKVVLIALDYNPTAQKVAESGYNLAKSVGAEVYLIHVVSDPVAYAPVDYSPIMGFSGYFNTDPLQINLIESLTKSSMDFLDQVKNHLYDQHIHILVKEGNSADEILKSAEALSADLIVMGSHSRKWLEKIVMGSVTEKVLNHARIPLLIVPTKNR